MFRDVRLQSPGMARLMSRRAAAKCWFYLEVDDVPVEDQIPKCYLVCWWSLSLFFDNWSNRLPLVAGNMLTARETLLPWWGSWMSPVQIAHCLILLMEGFLIIINIASHSSPGKKHQTHWCMRSMNNINTSRKCLSFNHTFRRQETTHSNVAFPCRWSNESTFEDTPVAMARFRAMRLPWIVARSWSMAHRGMAFVGSGLFSGSFLVNSVDCHDEYELILIIEYN